MTDTEKLQSQIERLQVEQEALVHDFEERDRRHAEQLEEAQAQSAAAAEERERLRKEIEELQQRELDLGKQLSTQGTRLAEVEPRAAGLQSEKEELERLVERLESRQLEGEGVREAKERRERELLQELEDTRSERSDLEAQIKSLELNKVMLQANVDRVAKDRDFFDKESDKAQAELKAVRESSRERVLELTQAAEDAKLQSEQAQSALEALKKSHEALVERHTTTSETLAGVREELLTKESQFLGEIESLQRVVELLESRDSERREQLAEAEAAIEAERVELSARAAQAEEHAAASRIRADELESQVDELKGALHRASHVESGMLDASGPSASSYTHLYSETMQLKEQLAQSRLEGMRVAEALDQVVRHVEERGPLLAEQRAEFLRMEERSRSVLEKLAQATQDVEDAERRADRAEARVKAVEKDKGLLEIQSDNLRRQLLVLMRRLAEEEIPGPVDSAAAVNPVSSAEELISTHLVTFSSIAELQQQHEKLLQISRDLARQLEAADQQAFERARDSENAAVQEAHDTIIALKDELERTRHRLDLSVRENRALRSGSSPLESNNHGGAIAGAIAGAPAPPHDSDPDTTPATTALLRLQAQFAAYQENALADYNALKAKYDALHSTQLALQTDLAKAKAQNEFIHERLTLALESADRSTKESRDAVARLSHQQQTLTQQDSTIEKLESQLIGANADIEKLRYEKTTLSAERHVWTSVEERLVAENANLTKERAQLADVLRTLQLTHSQLESERSSAKHGWHQHVLALEAQLSDLKRRLDVEVQNAQLAAHQKSQLERESAEKIDSLQTSLADTKAAAAASDAAKAQLDVRVADLEAQLAKTESRLTLVQTQPTTDASSAANTAAADSLEISDLRHDLLAARTEAAVAKEGLERLRQIAEDAEAQAQSSLDAHEAAKAEFASQIAAAESAAADAKTRIDTLTAQIDQLSKERDLANDTLARTQASLDEEQKKVESTLAQLTATESRFTAEKDALAQDLQHQQTITSDTYAKYEQEIVAHANALSDAKALRDQLTQAHLDTEDARAKESIAASNLATSSESWDRQKATYEKELAQLKDRISDLTKHNNILHGRLEEILESSKDNKLDTSAISSITDSASAETIKYLRREKDIADMLLDTSKQEVSRLRIQLKFTASQLDDAHRTLAEERDRIAQLPDASAAQHADILDKVSQISLLRESNANLRDQLTAAQTRLADLESQLASALQSPSADTAPLHELRAQLDFANNQIALLTADNAAWKDRNERLLTQFRDEAALEQQRTDLEQANAKLAELERDLSASRSTADDLRNKWQESRQRFIDLQKLARNERDEKNSLEQKLASAETDLRQKLESQLRSELESQLREKLETDLTPSIEARLKPAIEAQLKPVLEAQLESQIRENGSAEINQSDNAPDIESLRSEIEAQLRPDIEANVRAELESSVRAELEAQLESEVQSRVDQAKADAASDDFVSKIHAALAEADSPDPIEAIKKLIEIRRILFNDNKAFKRRIKELESQVSSLTASSTEPGPSAEGEPQVKEESKPEQPQEQVTADTPDSATHIHELEQQKADLLAQVASLQEELSERQSLIDSLQAAEASYKENIDKIKESTRREYALKIQMLQNQVNRLKTQLSEAQAQPQTQTQTEAAPADKPVPPAPAAPTPEPDEADEAKSEDPKKQRGNAKNRMPPRGPKSNEGAAASVLARLAPPQPPQPPTKRQRDSENPSGDHHRRRKNND